MSTLSLTLAQYAPSESVSANLRAMAPLVDQAVGEGSQLVVLPEYSHAFRPEFGDEWAASAESLEGEFVAGLTQLSQDKGGIVIVAGMLVASPGDDRPANTLVAAGEAGVMAVAEKIHLYDAFGSRESKWIRPGTLDTPQVFTVGG